MAQHDYNIANQAFPATRADLNNALSAIVTLNSGNTAPSTTFAHMLWADTTTNTLKQRNAANSGWIVRGTLDEAFVFSRSSNTMLDISDRDKVLIATGSYTQTFDAVATLGDGWAIDVIVDSGVTLTLDPNASETINGATTLAIVGPAQGRIVCNGSVLRTLGFIPEATESARGAIEIATQAEIEAGSSNVLAVTPGRLKAAIGFSDYYESAEQTYTAAGSLTLAHGMGRKPTLVQAWMKCNSAELGYSVGDEHPFFGMTDGDGSAGGAAPSVVADATNLNVRFGSGTLWLTHKTTGARSAATAASWRVIFKAWG